MRYHGLLLMPKLAAAAAAAAAVFALQLAGDVKALIAAAAIKQQEEPLSAADARLLWRVHGWLLHVSRAWHTSCAAHVFTQEGNSHAAASSLGARRTSFLVWCQHAVSVAWYQHADQVQCRCKRSRSCLTKAWLLACISRETARHVGCRRVVLYAASFSLHQSPKSSLHPCCVSSNLIGAWHAAECSLGNSN